jgi:hypothetical protein
VSLVEGWGVSVNVRLSYFGFTKGSILVHYPEDGPCSWWCLWRGWRGGQKCHGTSKVRLKMDKILKMGKILKMDKILEMDKILKID